MISSDGEAGGSEVVNRGGSGSNGGGGGTEGSGALPRGWDLTILGGKDTTLDWQSGDSSIARRVENRVVCTEYGKS